MGCSGSCRGTASPWCWNCEPGFCACAPQWAGISQAGGSCSFPANRPSSSRKWTRDYSSPCCWQESTWRCPGSPHSRPKCSFSAPGRKTTSGRTLWGWCWTSRWAWWSAGPVPAISVRNRPVSINVFVYVGKMLIKKLLMKYNETWPFVEGHKIFKTVSL